MYCWIDAAAQLVAAPLRLELLGDQRGPEELAHQLQVQHVADARAGVGMELLCPIEVLREGEHLVALDRGLRRSAAHDQLARLLHRQHARPRHALRQRPIEQPDERLLERAALAALGEIRGFLEVDRHAEFAGGADDGLRTLVRGGIHGAEEGRHRGGSAVVGVLAELVDRLRGRRQLLRLPLQLVFRLAHDEVEWCDDFLVGARARLEQRRDISGAGGKRRVRDQRQHEHPHPAGGVIAHLLPCRHVNVHLNPVRLRRTHG